MRTYLKLFPHTSSSILDGQFRLAVAARLSKMCLDFFSPHYIREIEMSAIAVNFALEGKKTERLGGKTHFTFP